MNNRSDAFYHHTLSNGLQVIINPDNTVPKVSVQVWYNVGSKDEQSGERGLAHLLEHMIFKGTKRLSESDINLITSKLSGYTNAFTSYDYTGYLFDFPKQYWTTALDILADCMVNCTFDEDMLQSELKAVVQELKLYKDEYTVALMEVMIGAIFPDHPYHHPIIGYKQDLWTINHQALMDFYKKHYRPNNATVVITGDINHEQALDQVKRFFGSIPAVASTYQRAHHAARDIKNSSITLYRDVQCPQLLYAWRIPGLETNNALLISIISYLFGQSKNSLLYHHLVDELHLATDVNLFLDDMFEHAVIFLQIDPINQKAITKIEQEVLSAIAKIHHNGFLQEQITSAIKQAQTEYLMQIEEFQERAYTAGKGYLATGNPFYVKDYVTSYDNNDIKDEIDTFFKTYIRSASMHKGEILPLPADEKQYWLDLQEESDRIDRLILDRKQRTTQVEPGKMVNEIHAQEPEPFNLPEHKKYILKNGLEIVYYQTPNVSKAEIVASCDADYYHDPEALQGLSNFVFKAMQESTKSYHKQGLMEALASKGMHLDIESAQINLTLLKDDLSFGLHIIHELLEHAAFNKKAIEKVRKQLLLDIADYWDSPNDFIKQLVRDHIYKNHPYSKHILGTTESIARIRQEDIIDYYKQYVTPHTTRIAIVADIKDNELQNMIDKIFGNWQGPQPTALLYPTVEQPPAQEIIYPMVRDQVVLAFAGLSVPYTHHLYNALAVLDQIFTGGAQRSMSSQLFQLREQTGLFYSIGGSLAFGATQEPGILYIKTMVSQDRLHEAERVIKETMAQATNNITQEDILIAKNGLAHQLVDHYATQKNMAESFLFLERMQLPKNHFTQRIATINEVTKLEIVHAAETIMHPEAISIFKVGRIT